MVKALLTRWPRQHVKTWRFIECSPKNAHFFTVLSQINSKFHDIMFNILNKHPLCFCWQREYFAARRGLAVRGPDDFHPPLPLVSQVENGNLVAATDYFTGIAAHFQASHNCGFHFARACNPMPNQLFSHAVFFSGMNDTGADDLKDHRRIFLPGSPVSCDQLPLLCSRRG